MSEHKRKIGDETRAERLWLYAALIAPFTWGYITAEWDSNWWWAAILPAMIVQLVALERYASARTTRIFRDARRALGSTPAIEEAFKEANK